MYSATLPTQMVRPRHGHEGNSPIRWRLIYEMLSKFLFSCCKWHLETCPVQIEMSWMKTLVSQAHRFERQYPGPTNQIPQEALHP